ncbi:MAG: hypothetical protein HY318_12075, partial [Armatimonadetes bacterium]|nr:hypothetical protein [Armatimonadota bacterium]
MYVFPFSIVTIVGVALVLSTAAADDRPAGVRGTAKVKKETVPRGRVIYNLDCSEFYVGTFGPIAPETIDKFVDAHAALGITDLFINVNAQRVNYRSAVW